MARKSIGANSEILAMIKAVARWASMRFLARWTAAPRTLPGWMVNESLVAAATPTLTPESLVAGLACSKAK